MPVLPGSVAHLPLAFSWLAPELARLPLPDEKRSDCGSCPLAGAPFHPTIRCCTYQPTLAPWTIGRALRRGGRGAETVRARLDDRQGRSERGLAPPPSWQAAYRREREQAFGRKAAWRCPYWVEGPLGCSIWHDRNAVCRTWHCRHDDGLQGHQLWVSVRGVLHAIEQRLTDLCVERLVAPPEDADPESWAGYFLEAAELVDRLEATELLDLEDAELASLRERLRQQVEALGAPVPPVVAPLVEEVREHPDGVELVGYSAWNPVVLPRTVFVLLAELDGERTWQEALERAQAADPSVQADWIERLWRHGLVREAGASEVAWGFEGPDLDPSELERLLR